LNVEGYEPTVLSGLKLTRHRPTYIPVEVWADTADPIAAILSTRYQLVAILGYIEEGDSALAVGPALKVGGMWEALYRTRA